MTLVNAKGVTLAHVMLRTLTYRHSMLLVLLAALPCSSSTIETAPLPGSGLTLPSLQLLTVERLRERSYGTTIQPAEPIAEADGDTYLASYESDGLRVFTRIDLPRTKPGRTGFPVLIFLHGWVGIDAAPGFDFYSGGDSWYSHLIAQYVAAGYVVLTPGFRGHGGAEGIEYLAAWDNGSYLSPVFYAVDVLNLIGGIDSLHSALRQYRNVTIDKKRLFLSGHSQGGDVALIVCAVAGENSQLQNTIAAASVWSGTFPGRLTQLETYFPMQATREAFVAGSGAWNGTPTGADGRDNPNFIFGYPPDWIGTPDPSEWTWQVDSWSLPSVADAWKLKLEQMYGALNERIADIEDATYSVSLDDSGKATIEHSDVVASAMARIGAYHLPEYLGEPLNLHFSDRDFYSRPEWNRSLCQRVNAAGGDCKAYEYAGTSHSLKVSEHDWFSPTGTRDGSSVAINRDLARFDRIGANARPD